ncbi:MAG: hypothetical protein DBP02_15120 [gamma proteobacterium symbiont of Ctena orbiculata]|nr:MAG: hypothetical protein DBP02_15120 [gamma proteobacterium symbiont of Ctena orbiculata]
MTDPIIVTGDDVELAVTLKKAGATFDMAGATIHARIVKKDNSGVITASVEQSEAANGADWANSRLILEIPTTETSGITYQGPALIEIQVNDGKKRTWFIDCKLVRGQIV